MAIYDYACTSCGHVTEVIHGIHEAGPRYCPACGVEGTMKKAFVAPTIHFKGTGWAKKDRSSSGTTSKSRPSKPAAEASPGAPDAGSKDPGATPGEGGSSATSPASTPTSGKD